MTALNFEMFGAVKTLA